MVDRVFAELGDRRRFPNLRKVVLTGFSAGGQFAGRYAAVGKGFVRDGVKVAYVAMAPSTELRFDPDTKWHYGLKNRPRRACFAGRHHLEEQIDGHAAFVLGVELDAG